MPKPPFLIVAMSMNQEKKLLNCELQLTPIDLILINEFNLQLHYADFVSFMRTDRCRCACVATLTTCGLSFLQSERIFQGLPPGNRWIAPNQSLYDLLYGRIVRGYSSLRRAQQTCLFHLRQILYIRVPPHTLLSSFLQQRKHSLCGRRNIAR